MYILKYHVPLDMILWTPHFCMCSHDVVGTIPKRPRGNPARHPPRDTWHLNSLSGFPQGGTRHSQTHGPDDPLSCPDMLFGPSISNLIKSLDRETRAILVYTARSTFDGTMLSHLRQPVTARISPPAERNDRNDGKPPSHDI